MTTQTTPQMTLQTTHQMMTKSILVLLITASCSWTLAQSNQAQSTSTSSSLAAPAPAPATSTSTTQDASQPSSLRKSIVLGWRSYNDMGRLGDLDSKTQRTSKEKQEFHFGYKHKSGWGAQGLAVQSYYSYNDSTKNRWGASDPSLTISHPAFISNDDFALFGSIRAYFPYTQDSIRNDRRHYAYYLMSSWNLSGGADVFNIAIPRWFAANKYKKDDTRFYIEDRTIYTLPINKEWRWSMGHWTQYEQHEDLAPSLCIEAVPQLDYMFSRSVFLGPRASFPIYRRNQVYDGPKAVALDQAYFELFMQAFL